MSKTLIVLIVGLMAIGCASTPTTPTMKSVAGTYERIVDGDTVKRVFLDNGIIEGYRNGNKEEEGKWKIVDGDIHSEFNSSGLIEVWIINYSAPARSQNFWRRAKNNK